MNEMRIFENEQFGKVRIIEEDGKVLFCGTDVAVALGYTNPRKAVRDHTPHGTKRSIRVQTGKKADGTPAVQMVETLFIPEGDVYRLITRSKLPAAEQFESWVFDEVLPSIRKTGGYIAGENQMSDDELVARALLMLKKKLEARNLELDQARGEIKQKGRPNPAPGPQGFLLRPGAPGQGGRAHLPDRQRLRPVGPRLKRHAA